MNARKLRIALLCDSPDERWYSMDLVASMLANQLKAKHSPAVDVTQIALPIRRVLSAFPFLQSPGFSVDRMFHRFAEYPAWLALHKRNFDIFHIVDHSYAQLAHRLPRNRTLITCHDLDAFACILNPARESRPLLFRIMTRHILRGLRRSARVICDSSTVKQELIRQNLVPERGIDVVALGVHPSCSPLRNVVADERAAQLLPDPRAMYILNVGSAVPRKRIDVLLKIVQRIRRTLPCVRLVRVGGPFTKTQTYLLEELLLSGAVDVLPYLDRDSLAAVYRRAAVVLVTSEAEGFGLPVLEAMACGTPVVASDIPVLREVGGSGVLAYCPVGDIEAWCNRLIPILQEHQNTSEWRHRVGANALAHAGNFSWSKYADRMMEIYSSVFEASATGPKTQ